MILRLTAAAERAKSARVQHACAVELYRGRDEGYCSGTCRDREGDRCLRAAATEACLHHLGWETTVTIRGDGKGGRNQEFVLAAAIDIAGLKDVCMLSGGTDGTDGPTDAAGAICDSDTLGRVRMLRCIWRGTTRILL